MVNTLSKQVMEECFLNPAKGIHQKLKAKALLNGKMLKNFPLSLGAGGGGVSSPLCSATLAGALRRAVEHEKRQFQGSEWGK